MVQNNPFTISFGIHPECYILRRSQSLDILSNFNSGHPVSRAYLISGLRGSGKTVFMSSLANEFRKNDSWITIDLNPNRDMLQPFAAKLYSHPQLQKLFLEANLNLSFLGIGISVKKGTVVTDVEEALRQMLFHVQKAGRRILVTIDEVTKNKHLAVFAASFQSFLREQLPVFLLMTGLYENIRTLQNEKSLTFLYRTPRIVMEPLNLSAVISEYRKWFHNSFESAAAMARLTKGYPFAFQILGYLCWESGNTDSLDELLPEYDQMLEEYVYDKVWSELSSADKTVLTAIAESESGQPSIREVREKLQVSPQYFYQYKKRLQQKGLLLSGQDERLLIPLPRFERFVRLQLLMDEQGALN